MGLKANVCLERAGQQLITVTQRHQVLSRGGFSKQS